MISDERRSPFCDGVDNDRNDTNNKTQFLLLNTAVAGALHSRDKANDGTREALWAPGATTALFLDDTLLNQWEQGPLGLASLGDALLGQQWTGLRAELDHREQSDVQVGVYVRAENQRHHYHPTAPPAPTSYNPPTSILPPRQASLRGNASVYLNFVTSAS
ncbi:unnamed protein product [Lota lota]